MAITLRRPSPGVITSGFGPRTPGKVGSTYHEGIDFGWGNGWTITAAAAGVVTFVGYRAGYGNLTIIDHGHGVETRYAHQSSISVVVGERVVAGEAIGVIGNTGTSAGAHLHFELWINGRKVNPMPYFTTTAGDDFERFNDTESETDMPIFTKHTGEANLWILFTGDHSYTRIRTHAAASRVKQLLGRSSTPASSQALKDEIARRDAHRAEMIKDTADAVLAAQGKALTPAIDYDRLAADSAAAFERMLAEAVPDIADAVVDEFKDRL